MSETICYAPRAAELLATAVEHDGVPYMLCAMDDKLHCIPREVFDLMYQRHPNQRPVAVIGDHVASQAPPREAKPAKPSRLQVAKAAKKVAAAAPAGSQEQELDAYPATLRDSRAFALRAVYDRLKRGSCPLPTLVADLQGSGWPGATSSNVMAALMGLREKRLARKLDAIVGGDWELV
jgi:hypothetical protein